MKESHLNEHILNLVPGIYDTRFACVIIPSVRHRRNASYLTFSYLNVTICLMLFICTCVKLKKGEFNETVDGSKSLKM